MPSLVSKPFVLLQQFVDSIGMYRVVSGALGVLAGLSILAGFTGLLAYSGLGQIFALALALLTALVCNYVFGFLFRIPVNHESAVITALILFFLTIPQDNIFENWPLMAAVGVGVASKYIFVYKKQHFMNPAACGAAALSLLGIYKFTWWVANPVLFIPIVVLGVMVVMKIRKWVPVLAFIGVSAIIYLAESLRYGEAIGSATDTFFLSWPTLFLAFFMLTEPFTMPASKGPQMLYGGLVGFISNTTLFMPIVAMTPELALVIGNILMTPARLTQKLFLQFESKATVAKDTVEFTFTKPAGFGFIAGQYLEWMLPHTVADSKGIRRYFTIASAPTESKVKIAMKISETRSSFKHALDTMDTGEPIIASQLAGDFILPSDSATKLGCIAGGIGVTPFKSHVQYMIDSDKAHDTVLYYCVNTSDEIAYRDFWVTATHKINLKFIAVVAKETVEAPAEQGFVTAEMIKRRTPDFLERTWYLSGPPGMVNAYKKLLREIGVPRKQIKTDFFSGAV
jgi:glycine betaine catabolism B